MGRTKGGGTVHFVTRNGKGRLVEIDQSEYYAAQANPELVELKPGHFMKRETAEKYGLAPLEPEITFDEFYQKALDNGLREELAATNAWIAAKHEEAQHEKTAILLARLDAAWEASQK